MKIEIIGYNPIEQIDTVFWMGWTDKDGKAHKTLSMNKQHFPDGVSLTIKASKTNYDDYEKSGSYFYNAGYFEEIPLHETGWTPPSPDGDGDSVDQRKWFLQPWQERLAYSIVIALAIIMTFKFLQGFSMERVNPL